MLQSQFGVEDFFELRMPQRGRKQLRLHCKLCGIHEQYQNGGKSCHLLSKHRAALTACQIQECEDDLENARAKRRVGYKSANKSTSSSCECGSIHKANVMLISAVASAWKASPPSSSSSLTGADSTSSTSGLSTAAFTILKSSWNSIIKLDALYAAPVGSQTYGFITFEGLARILLELNIGSNDRFLDLGAAVGNTLATAALLFNCQADGIELRENLVTSGLGLLKDVASRAEEVGLQMATARLRTGDLQYLDRQKALKKLVQEATIILMVDEKFDETLRQFLIKTISLHGHHGCKILSCLPATTCHQDRPSSRLPHDPLLRLGNCSSISGQSHPSIPPNSLFSWTDRPYMYKTEILGSSSASSSCSLGVCR